MANLRKVYQGRKGRIPATAFNAMVDSARDYRDRSIGARDGMSAPQERFRHGCILVRNDTGADLPIFSVIALKVVLTNPDESEEAGAYVFQAQTPDVGDENKFAVLQEAVNSGDTGLAMVSGLTPVLISRGSGDTSTTVAISPGNTYLETSPDGAELIYEDAAYSGTAIHRAIIAVPVSGAAAGESQIICDLATTANTTFPGSGTIDGITLTDGDVILVWKQTTASQNGIYEFASGTWTKTDELGIDGITRGHIISVIAGTQFGQAIFMVTANDEVKQTAAYWQ